MDPGVAHWLRWQQDQQFGRFIEDLLLHTIARLRPGLRPRCDVDFGETGLDLDSLERFNLAVAVAEALQWSRIDSPESLGALNSIPAWTNALQTRRSEGAHTIGFRSSGTTGASGFTAHSLAALGQEVEALAALIGPRGRILSAVPAHHIYGFLFTVLLPQQLQAGVLDIRAIPAPAVGGQVRPGDLVVGFPQFWQAASIADWPPDIVGISSTGALAPGVHASLCEHGLSRLIEVYGSSETAGIGWRDRPDEGFQLFSYWQREDDGVLSKGPDGATRRYRLPDLVEWQGETLLTPVARCDGAVQIGGINVDPQKVRNVLLAHPAVVDAAVRAMRHEEGDRLKAFVVPRDSGTDQQALRAELDIWLKQSLAPKERPKAITFGAAIPTGAMGKLADWPLPLP